MTKITKKAQIKMKYPANIHIPMINDFEQIRSTCRLEIPMMKKVQSMKIMMPKQADMHPLHVDKLLDLRSVILEWSMFPKIPSERRK